MVTYFEPPWYTKQSESLFIKMMIAAFLGSNGCFFLMWPFPVSVAKSFATIDYGTFFVRYEVLGMLISAPYPTKKNGESCWKIHGTQKCHNFGRENMC